MALGVGREGGAARVALHGVLVRAAPQGDTAGRGADAVRKAVEGVLEVAVRAEEKAATATDGLPPFSRWQEDQISSGCVGPHSCQAFSTAAALDHGHVTYAVTPWGAGWVLKRSSVTTPKLPLPAPRRAQKRSLFVVAFAISCLPSAVIRVAWVRLSQVRP